MIYKIASILIFISISIVAQTPDEKYFPFCVNGKWGFTNSSREIKIPAVYDSVVFPHNRNHHLVIYQKHECALFSKNGNQLSPFIYDTIEYSLISSLDYIIVKANGKYGFIDSIGNQICKPVFDEVYNFDNSGLARVKDNHKWGLINKTGKIILKPTFDDIRFFSEDGTNTYAERNGLFCHINNKGKILYAPRYKRVEWLEGKKVKYAIASNGDKSGIIDAKGRIIAPFIYDYVEFIESDSIGLPVFKCETGGKTQFYKGKQCMDTYNPESLGAMVYEDLLRDGGTDLIKSVEILNKKDSIVITAKKEFYKKTFVLKKQFDSIQFFNLKGFVYREFEDICFLTWKNGETGIMDISEKVIIPPKVQKIYPIETYSTILVIESNGLKALYNFYTKNWICPLEYISFECCSGGDGYSAAYILATKANGTKGYLTTQGKNYFPKME